MSTSDTGLRRSLPDLCSGFFTFALQLRKAKDPGEYEPLRLKIDERFRELETGARQADVPQEYVQLAKYALCAYVDEMVLTSQWPIRETWSGKPLQLEFFNDFSAGEEFYNKMENLRGSEDPRKVDTLEVYFLCLSLGFKGKYADLQGLEKRKVLMDSVAREIRAARKQEGEALSPKWEQPEDFPQMIKRLPEWVVAVACGAVLLIVFLILSSILGGMAGGVENALR